MATKRDEIIRRLRKVIELAERGVGGEKTAAERLLNETLQRYNITLDEVRFETPKSRDLYYKNVHHRRILSQTIWSCIEDNDDTLEIRLVAMRGSRKKWLRFEATDAQFAEIAAKYDFFIKQFDRQFRDLQKSYAHAFIVKNEIFPKNSTGVEASELTPKQLEEIKKAQELAAVIERTPFNKQLKK